MAGDRDAQARLAVCYASREGCVGSPSDPALGCAWRGVRLASRGPDVSLLDETAFISACSGADETFRQRAGIALDDLTRRIYRRPIGGLDVLNGGAGGRRLYPSMEVVRQRINRASGELHLAALPRFGPPKEIAATDRLLWTSCTANVCLEGETPAFGGGVFDYRTTVSAFPDPARNLSAVAKLTAAGLGVSGVAGPLSDPSTAPKGERRVSTPEVCWRSGMKGAAALASATPGPC